MHIRTHTRIRNQIFERVLRKRTADGQKHNFEGGAAAAVFFKYIYNIYILNMPGLVRLFNFGPNRNRTYCKFKNNVYNGSVGNFGALLRRLR